MFAALAAHAPHVPQMVSGRGLLEDLRLGTEVAVGRVFGAIRHALHRLLLLDSFGSDASDAGGDSREDSPAELLERRMRRRESTPPLGAVPEEAEAAAISPPGSPAAAGRTAAAVGGSAPPAAATARHKRRVNLRNLLRSGRHWEEDLSVWTASDVILREGYPLEQHSVTTTGGPGRAGMGFCAAL